jgi:peptidoglycan lytic transglycosylase G
VTDSTTPPGDNERPAARARAASTRPADPVEPKPRAEVKPAAGTAERLLNGGASSSSRPRVSNAALLTRIAATKSAPPRSAAAPLSESALNGIATAPNPARRADPNRINPRSPRAALEPDRVEMPVRRSKRARHPLVIVGNAIISLFLVLVVAAGYMLYVGKQRFDAPGPLLQDRVVNIPRGSGIRDITDVLSRDGVIDQPWVFIGGVLLLKAHEGLKAGEYQFKAHASLSDVVATLSEGKVVVHQISVPEGFTSEQIVARLMADDVLTGNIDEIPPEGSMLPDTYSFTRGMTRAQMIAHMQQAEQRLVKEIWERRSPDLPLKTPEQLVILASLVEKETGKPEERTRIAAVFVNRLKQRMRLQSDPTIIYGLVGGKGTLGRPIMKSEIDQPTPYNTYQIDGLPPGPIANPGRAALEAAANPARTRELYFVADGSGGHAFAETYEQHQKNVLRLRQLQSGQPGQKETGLAPAGAQAAPPAQPVAAPPPPPASASSRTARRKPHRRAQSAE